MGTYPIIEEESGTTTGRRVHHPHNGYYAGDFSDPRYAQPATWPQCY